MSPTVDHVIPLSRGGLNRKENKKLCCKRCNNEKGDMLPDEYREFMARMAGVTRFRDAAAKQIRVEIMGRRRKPATATPHRRPHTKYRAPYKSRVQRICNPDS